MSKKSIVIYLALLLFVSGIIHITNDDPFWPHSVKTAVIESTIQGEQL